MTEPENNHTSPQMMVLGSTADDQQVVSDETTTPSNWKQRRSKHRKENDIHEVVEAEQPSLISRLFGNEQHVRLDQNSPQHGSQLEQRILQQPIDATTTTTSNPTQEELLQHDCSFFYRDMDDTPQRQRRQTPRFSSLLRETSTSIEPAYTIMSSPPILQNFRNQYDRLNQEVIFDNDLELTHGDVGDIGMLPRTTEYSSLFYVRHGKLLMTLPQDYTRLAMEPDLEAGIISVEQRRRGSSADPATEPLHYVLTVPDDLYRRVVADLSNGIYRPYWGMTVDQKVDIRVALVLLALVFLFLWINVMVWPHQ